MFDISEGVNVTNMSIYRRSTANQINTLPLLSYTPGENRRPTCEALDVIRLCCHAAVL